MRNCCQCHATDREIPQPYEAAAEHFVVPEVRYLEVKESFAESDRKKGWSPKTFQGRPAKERFICRGCLVENEKRDRVWNDMRKAARQLESQPEDQSNADHYRLLCEA